MKISLRRFVVTFLFSVAGMFSSGAQAQGIPVYDNLQFINGLQQVMNTLTQIKAQYDQLTQLQQQLKAITGGRGMEVLLNNVNRDYLPPDLSNIIGSVQQIQGQYSDIAQKIQSITGKNGVLSAADMANMPPDMVASIQRMRQAIATQTAMSQVAYKNASDNVGNLRALISQIGAAGDQKAIADLSARIQAEQAMIQNDANKLAQATALHAAEQRQIEQQLDERSMAMAGKSLSSSRVTISAPQ